MKRVSVYILFLILIVISGCATLNKDAIFSLQRVPFEKPVIKPACELYNLRIDIIRQKTTEAVNDSTQKETDMPYHRIGFDLTGGLFYDANKNLSLNVLKLFNINETSDFEINYEEPGIIFTKKIKYIKKGSEFRIENNDLLKTKEIFKIAFSDSVINVKKKFAFNFKIIKTSDKLMYKQFLKNKTIHKSSDGYYIKNLLFRETFKCIDNQINLDDDYVLNYNRDVVEIYENGFLGKLLKYFMIRSNNEVYFYDKSYMGLRVFKNGNKITVEKNGRFICTYKNLTKAEN